MVGRTFSATNPTSDPSYSIQLVRQWTRGESPVQSRLLVDVRDAAAAHVAMARHFSTLQSSSSPSSSRLRYIVSTDARVPSADLADWMRAVVQERAPPDQALEWASNIYADEAFTGGAIPIGAKEVEAAQRLKSDLGITLRPIQETIQDMTRIVME